MAYKTVPRVTVPNLKLFGKIKTELWAKEFGEFSLMLSGENGLVGILLPTNMAATI